MISSILTQKGCLHETPFLRITRLSLVGQYPLKREILPLRFHRSGHLYSPLLALSLGAYCMTLSLVCSFRLYNMSALALFFIPLFALFAIMLIIHALIAITITE